MAINKLLTTIGLGLALSVATSAYAYESLEECEKSIERVNAKVGGYDNGTLSAHFFDGVQGHTYIMNLSVPKAVLIEGFKLNERVEISLQKCFFALGAKDNYYKEDLFTPVGKVMYAENFPINSLKLVD